MKEEMDNIRRLNGAGSEHGDSAAKGKLFVLTAPLTEIIDHAGFFIQMAMASMPTWMEGVMQQEVPRWRELERNEDGSARCMTAGVRILESSLFAAFSRRCSRLLSRRSSQVRRSGYPRGCRSTHNPLGVTFAAGVYASVFGTSKNPINCHYARQLFASLEENPWRNNFKVIVGGAGAWQITQTRSHEELGIDCVVDGRSESAETLELLRKAVRAEIAVPTRCGVPFPRPGSFPAPEKRTTFGVVEMTSRLRQAVPLLVPELSPQIDLPKEKIMAGVRANVLNGNKQISLATEDMFIWGQVQTDTPFYFPNREALLDLYAEVVNTPGVEQLPSEPQHDVARGG